MSDQTEPAVLINSEEADATFVETFDEQPAAAIVENGSDYIEVSPIDNSDV